MNGNIDFKIMMGLIFFSIILLATSGLWQPYITGWQEEWECVEWENESYYMLDNCKPNYNSNTLYLTPCDIGDINCEGDAYKICKNANNASDFYIERPYLVNCTGKCTRQIKVRRRI